MTNLPKAKHYQHFYSLLNVEKYLLTDMSPQSRRILSNFRCSSHTLNVEIGRHKNIDYNLRFCDSCLKRNVFVIEDEFHFLLNCPQYDELRSLYFVDEWKNAYPTITLFYRIMSDNKEINIKQLAKYLIEAFKLKRTKSEN